MTTCVMLTFVQRDIKHQVEDERLTKLHDASELDEPTSDNRKKARRNEKKKKKKDA